MYCSGIQDVPVQGVDFWPVKETNYTWNGTLVTAECFDPNTNGTIEAICESPLVSSGTYCSFECPLPSLTPGEYDSAKLMQGIVGWFSWVPTKRFSANSVLMILNRHYQPFSFCCWGSLLKCVNFRNAWFCLQLSLAIFWLVINSFTLRTVS